MAELPEGFSSTFVDCGEVRLHVVHNAAGVDDGRTLRDDRSAIVFLHGFPEYWAGWQPVFRYLSKDYLLIAPDQRGYNLSDAPQPTESYAASKLVGDILAMADHLLRDRKFILCGHDWGASVAYALAIRHSERLKGLVIANGVHPVLFQRALLNDERQKQASQYFHILTAEGAAERMTEHDFARTLTMFEKFSHTPWLDDATRSAYRKAWSGEGRLNAMLNWYRASPVIVPKPGEPNPDAPLALGTPEQFSVRVPHLLVWGMKDQALLPVLRRGLEEFAPDLRVVEIYEGDHWVIHTHPEQIATQIGAFAQSLD